MPNDRSSSPLVVTSCDDRYLWPWACALYSAVSNAKESIRFVLANVNGLLSPSGVQLARDFFAFLGVEGEILDVSLAVEEIHTYQWNATTYARLALMDSLDERFLWVDSDTILCAGWARIFSEADELMDNPEIVACAVRDRPATLESMRRTGTNSAYLLAKDAYFNAGIIYVDPLRWRDDGSNHDWLDLVATQAGRGFEFLDQDVLNLLIAGRVGLLDARFNHIVSEPTDGTEAILHYAGFPKPWRLTEAGRAFFVASEAANYDRPQHQISGGGRAWEQFPRYWEVERSLISSLQRKEKTDLASALLGHRSSQFTPLSKREEIKLWILRLFSRKLLNI